MESIRSLTDLLILNELGKGSYGVVHRVQHIRTKQVYALKRVNLEVLTPSQQEEAKRETEMMRQLDHPFIVKYLGSFTENSTLHILMEYATQGDLQKRINNNKAAKLLIREEEIWKWCNQIVHALAYLHSKHIVHRDIKALNILISDKGKAKIADLGASSLMRSHKFESKAGTPMFLAPEQVKQLPYDYKVDIWGLGCVLYSLATLNSPFKGENLITLGMNIVNTRPKPLPREYSTDLEDLIFRCLEKDPAKRISIQELEDNFSGAEKRKVLASCNKQIMKKTPINKSNTLRPFTSQNLKLNSARFFNPLFKPREITIFNRTAQFTLPKTLSDTKASTSKITISQLHN